MMTDRGGTGNAARVLVMVCEATAAGGFGGFSRRTSGGGLWERWCLLFDAKWGWCWWLRWAHFFDDEWLEEEKNVRLLKRK